MWRFVVVGRAAKSNSSSMMTTISVDCSRLGASFSALAHDWEDSICLSYDEGTSMNLQGAKRNAGRKAEMKLRSRPSGIEAPAVPNTIIGVGSSFRGTMMVEGTLRIE